MKLTYIFVHGLSGWGSYDDAYRRMPYWGMRGGDLMTFLQEKGFDCHAASVAPTGSAWDRACELYAQLAGTRVDYGEAHSRKYGHDRFGADFTGRPLIKAWQPETRLVLLGHSFGGATVRLFAHLLACGDEEEQRVAAASAAASTAASAAASTGASVAVPAIVSEDLSPLFAGGMGNRIHSIVTLAAPTNGTTAYDLFTDPTFDPGRVRVPWWSRPMARMMSAGTKPKTDSRDERDYAGYDMHIDRALQLNDRIKTQPNVYYFSVPCSFTKPAAGGRQRPKKGAKELAGHRPKKGMEASVGHRPKRGMEPLFVMRACQIGAYTGRTKGGTVIDEAWQENDGLVNTISARYPLGAPWKELDKAHIEPGVWNVFPDYDGDHMALQGGLMHRHEIRGFYVDLLNMIDKLR